MIKAARVIARDATGKPDPTALKLRKWLLEAARAEDPDALAALRRVGLLRWEHRGLVILAPPEPEPPPPPTPFLDIRRY